MKQPSQSVWLRACAWTLGGLLLTGSAGAATHPLGWGLNGDKQASPVPTNVMDDATSLAAGYYHSLAIKDGQVWTWGSSSNGLGVLPLAVQSGVAAVAGGGAFSLALKTNGAVIGWGGGSAATNVPVSLESGATKIVAGEAHGLALKDGGVVAWGSNTYGQCDVPDSLTNDVDDIAAGSYFSVALKNGAVEVFGIAASNPAAWSIRDVPPEANSGVTAVAAGPWHALALKDGGVIAWGVPHWDATNVPSEATSDVAAIAAGDCFSVARKTDGTLVAWGDNSNGQTDVPGFASTGVSAISAGKGHVLAICAAMPPRFISFYTPNAFRDNVYSNGYVQWAGDPAVTYHKHGATFPAWLTLDENTGALGGTPPALGSFTFAVVASNAFGRSTNSSFRVVVFEKPAGSPVFVTTNLPGGTVGAPYGETIVVSNGASLSVVNGSLPAGLSMDTNGWVAGTPTAVEAPQFIVRATNLIGWSTQIFQIAVSAPPVPVFTTTDPLPSGVQGQAYLFQVAADNYPTNFGVASGALPLGLGITAAGMVTGTPRVAGTANFTLFASNLTGGATSNYTLLVNGPPQYTTTSPLPDGVLGVAYAAQIEATGATAFNMFFGGLHAGLGLRSDGMITGTPATVGTSNFTVRATNDYGWSNRTFALTVGAVPVFVTPSDLPPGTSGVAYVAVQIEATGATAYSLVGGALPNGMNLSGAGLLDGTPLGAGPYDFIVRATNASGHAEREFNLAIASANTNHPFFTTRPLYTNGVLYLGWTNPNAGGAVSVWRSTNVVGTNAAWSNLGPASVSPWSNAAPPPKSYYQLRLAP